MAPFTAGWASSDSEAPLLCVGPRPMWLATCDWPPWRRPRHDPAAPARGLRMPQLAGAHWHAGSRVVASLQWAACPRGPYPLAALWGGAASRPRLRRPGAGAALASRGGKLTPGRPHVAGSPPQTQGGRAAGDGDNGECQSDCALGPRSEPESISTRELTIPIGVLSCTAGGLVSSATSEVCCLRGYPEVTERTQLG